MSAIRFLTLSLFCAKLVASLQVIKRQAPAFAFEGDAPFSVDAEILASALTCPNGYPTASSPPVLLVHGTSTTGEETWGDGYVPALKEKGFTACYVTLPGRAMGDMQVSSEYVAYNLHYLSQLSGGLKPAVISHSQGGPNTQWALQFWPSTRSVTSSFIPLSPDFEGIDLLGSDLSSFCIGDLCQACIWQQSDGSNYFNALHGHDFTALVPTTVVWTKTDGVVEPAKLNARLPGSTAISLQDLCPLRFTTHVQMTMDAAAFAIALDALQHEGIGSLARVKKQRLKTCWRISAPGMDINIADQIRGDFDSITKGYTLGGSRVSKEPPVMAYAQ
ncbi:hypothetical protein KC343_g5505 [Hortaea werneckii]|uniref:AB hydrolase-1 domain-containing protein n=1 Tax=Hortaea werneckii TaxID=91943 RepID=A0A3M7DA05_HORWE|nr:hypothetical protein KC352_g13694 [Hortaea werneckii]KAI7564927.1 hypothetical protein KC317_g6717 [Hortaea werneckii]KAI7614226.1 hypothetical protein KC346_g7014 [Hortaea werneckii]KAI7628977.1 hypothetical protein KC343_g5505 [Hortaea werneckii]KAI7667608.1 hypothetical protein KC319_g6622 [Hortaea werneckii]